MEENYLDELSLTPEEKELLRRAETSQGGGAGTGAMIGTGIGALAGGLIGNIPGAGLGAGLGGSVGGWLGALLGGKDSEEAAAQFQKLRAAREKPLREEAERNRAIDELLGPWARHNL